MIPSANVISAVHLLFDGPRRCTFPGGGHGAELHDSLFSRRKRSLRLSGGTSFGPSALLAQEAEDSALGFEKMR